MIAFYGCDNGSNFYDREIVVSEDCTIGDRVGVEFDSDSVRCGMSGNIYLVEKMKVIFLRLLFMCSLIVVRKIQGILYGFWKLILIGTTHVKKRKYPVKIFKELFA